MLALNVLPCQCLLDSSGEFAQDILKKNHLITLTQILRQKIDHLTTPQETLNSTHFLILCTYKVHGIKFNNYLTIHPPTRGAKIQSTTCSSSGSTLVSFQLPVYYRKNPTITADTCYSKLWGMHWHYH